MRKYDGIMKGMMKSDEQKKKTFRLYKNAHLYL